MLIIRETLIAKPGMASKLAKLMKEAMADTKAKVMTDLTGVFNKVVMETEVKNLAEFERRMVDYKMNATWSEKMKGYTEMYRTGKREIFQLLE